MQFYVFNIYHNIGDPELGSGWLRAQSPEHAFSIIGHDDAEIVRIPDDSGFPETATGSIFWDRRHVSLWN